MATLLEECIEALGEDIEILENTQGKMVVKVLKMHSLLHNGESRLVQH